MERYKILHRNEEAPCAWCGYPMYVFDHAWEHRADTYCSQTCARQHEAHDRIRAEETMAQTTYTTWGPVRGGCGHRHRTLSAAWRCLERDGGGCAQQGGYSDRVVRALDPGMDVLGNVEGVVGRALNHAEIDALARPRELE